MKRATVRRWLIGFSIGWFVALGFVAGRATYAKPKSKKASNPDILANAVDKVTRGRQTFRFDTFGDQAFWGDNVSSTARLKAPRLAASVLASVQEPRLRSV